MAKEVPTIQAATRDRIGSRYSKRLRAAGRLPAVIYGSGTELVHVALPEHDLNLALRRPRVVLSVSFDGSTVLVKPRDIQRDPVKRTLEHVDLVVVSQQEAAAIAVAAARLPVVWMAPNSPLASRALSRTIPVSGFQVPPPLA